MCLFDVCRLRITLGIAVLAGVMTANQANAGIIVSLTDNVTIQTILLWNKVPDPQTTQPFIARDNNSRYEFYATSPQTTFAEGGAAGGVFGGVPRTESPFASLTFSTNKTLLETNGQPAGSPFTIGAFSANIDAIADGFLQVNVVGIGFAPFSTILSGLNGNGVNRLDVYTTNFPVESISSITLTTVTSSTLPGVPTNNIQDVLQFRVDDFNVGSSSVVPEPASLSVFGIGAGVVGIVAARRRRLQKNTLQAES